MITFHKDGTLPQNGEVFVFGSNLAGIHGAGAAKVAFEKYGALHGIGRGLQLGDRSYAIPTKDSSFNVIPLFFIQEFVEVFVELTQDCAAMSVSGIGGLRDDLKNGFFVTRVGCGLAGYKDSDIAPMFRGAMNCSFAEEWAEWLK